MPHLCEAFNRQLVVFYYRNSMIKSLFRSRSAGYIFALLATVIWSGNFVVARGLSQEIAPVTLAFCRWTTAMLVLLPFAFSGLIQQWEAIRKNLLYISVTSLLGITVFNTIIYMAGHQTTVLNLSLIAVLSPVFIIFLSHIFLNDPITPTRLAGVILAAAGVVLLTTKGDLSVLTTLQFNGGDLLMLFATFLFAVYTIMVRKRPVAIAPVPYLCATFIIGWLLLIPWVAAEWLYVPFVMPAPHVWWIIVYVGVGASLVAFLFWNYAVAGIGPAKAGIVYYSLPFFCGVEAWLILGESITWIHAVAGAMIISGIFVANR